MDDGTLNIFDCGTGVHGLGQELMASGKKNMKGNILILFPETSGTSTAPAGWAIS